MRIARLYIVLAKLGDILTALPLLYSDFLAGHKSSLMVSRKYAEVLEGVSYVNPVIFEGEPSDIEGAVQAAKKTGMPWVVAQVCGPPELTQKYVYHETAEYKADKIEGARTDSWTKETFRAAGRWGAWRGQPPLVFDQRNAEREAVLFATHGVKRLKAILVSCRGETAPFRHKELLMELIRGRFRSRFQILDLDDVKADRFYDLLGLYDRARCLVAVDSAPLHLARASNVPTLALINDKPTLWHGSAWRPNHVFHCRYGNFADRALELLTAIENIRDPGCPCNADRSKRTFIHAWSAYEITPDTRERHERAKATWKAEYYRGNWINGGVEVGSCGRDSKLGPLKDTSRYPYLRDVIQQAEMRAGPDDVIVITPADVSFNGGMGGVSEFPCWGTRTVRTEAGDTHSPRVDFLAFTKKWWNEHRGAVPDFIMGPDAYWSHTLKELIRANGGKAVDGVTFREEAA